MVVKWYTKAQEHWDEQLGYCAETFGVKTALDCVKTAEEKDVWNTKMLPQHLLDRMK